MIGNDRSNGYLRACLLQNLAAEKTYNDLDVSLKKANEHRNEWFEGVHKCKLDETLFTIMDKIVKAEVRKNYYLLTMHKF